MVTWNDRRAVVAWSGLLALAVSAVGLAFLPTAELPAWHLGQLEGRGGFTTQYRLLSFLWPELLHRLGLPLVAAYAVGGALVLCAAFLVSDLALRAVLRETPPTLRTRLTALGLLAFAYGFGLSRVIQPVDPWSLCTAALFVWACFGAPHERPTTTGLKLTLVLALAALTKETPLLCLPLFLWVQRRRLGFSKALALTALALVPFAAIYLATHSLVRVTYGYPLDNFAGNWSGMDHLRAPDLAWLLLFAPAWVLLGRHWSALPPHLRALTLTALLPVGFDLEFGRVVEVRIFVDAFVLLLPPLALIPTLGAASARSGLALLFGSLTAVLGLSFAAHEVFRWL